MRPIRAVGCALALIVAASALPAQDRSALTAERATLVAVQAQEARLRDTLSALVSSRAARIRIIDSLLAIPEPTPTPVPEPTPTAPLLFLADAETGDTKQWCWVHSGVPVGLVTTPVRDGRYAFKSEIRDGVLIYSSERSSYENGPDLCGKHTYNNGDENFTAFSVYLAADFPRYSSWSLVTQWKGVHTGTPPLQLYLSRDAWGVYGSGRISPRPFWSIGAIQRGRWTDFVFHVKWSPDPKIGWFAVYQNGVLVIPKTFTATMYVDNGVVGPLFLSVGHYRDTANSGTAILYVDAVKVGNSLSAVAPR